MIKRLLQVAVCGGLVSAALAPSPAFALDGGAGGTISRTEPLGTCEVNITSINAPPFIVTANIFVRDAGLNILGYAGSTIFLTTPTPTPAPSTLTPADIESCGLLNVTNLVQDGADGTYATDNEMFFRFRATDPGDGRTYDYEFALRGVTNTQAVVTRVPLPEDSTEPEPEKTAEDIQRPVSDFLQARAANTLATQPELTRFLSNPGDASFSAQASRGTGQLSFGSAATGAFWTDVQAGWSQQDDTDSSYVIGTVGGHLQANPNLLLGLMASADRAEDDQDGADIEGTGWLAGPYFVARLPGQPLYFEGRLLYGETENDVDIDDSKGDFDSERLLIQTRITGEIERGALTLFPHLDYSRITDDQDDFTTSDDIDVPDQKVELSYVTLGMDFNQPLPVPTGDLALVGGVSAIWSDTDGEGLPSGVLSSGEDTRGRVDLGLDYTLNPRNTLRLETFYDGIGADDFEGYGMSLNWALDF